jgi:hypothetical protein
VSVNSCPRSRKHRPETTLTSFPIGRNWIPKWTPLHSQLDVDPFPIGRGPSTDHFKTRRLAPIHSLPGRVGRHVVLPRECHIRSLELQNVVAADASAPPSHLVTPRRCGQFRPPPQGLACQSDLVTQRVRQRFSVANTQDDRGASAVLGPRAQVRGSSSRSPTCATSAAGSPPCSPSGIAPRNSSAVVRVCEDPE